MLIKKSSLNNLIISLIFSGTIIVPNNKLPYNEFLKYRNKVLEGYELKKVDNKSDTLVQQIEKKINDFFLKFPELAKGWSNSRKDEPYPYFKVYLLNRREFNQREGLIFSNPPEKSVKGDEISESFAINRERELNDFELIATLTYFLAQHSENPLINQNYFFIYLLPLHLGHKPLNKIEHVLQDADKIIFALYFLAGETFFKSSYSSFCPELEEEIDKKLGKGAYYKIVQPSNFYGYDFRETEKLLKKAGLYVQFKQNLEEFLKTYFKKPKEEK
ncbi:MAG: hypothetical protein ACK4J0_01850 [Candidatus Anstonellaceae archaeon]